RDRYKAGGEPGAIVNLGYEDFLAFHSKYYHPSNSYIYIYGNGEIDNYMQYINNEYLQSFEQIDEVVIEQQPKLNEHKNYDYEYSIDANGDASGKYYFSLNFLGPSIHEREKLIALGILGNILGKNMTSPLKSALMSKDIAKDIKCRLCDWGLVQSVFTIGATNADESKKEVFLSTIKETLSELAKKGINPELIEAELNRVEFNLNEANPYGDPKGILYMDNSLSMWACGGNPIDALEYSKYLKSIRAKIQEGYFEKLLDEIILSNEHSTFVTYAPVPGLQEKLELDEKERLAGIKASMSTSEIENIVANTKFLKEEALKKDSKEALETLPRLSVKDLDPKTRWKDGTLKNIDGVNIKRYPQKGKDLVCAYLEFDCKTVDQDM
ncbi:MAG: insulinase family protein, partial [Candidatus Methanomethyliaceae archaeon]|nr:insulinase family protein [Candidatus Methanomethyliaceae archaeon]